MKETPKAQKGTWTLIAPDGRKWTAEGPLAVAAIEMHERVPAEVGALRIIHGIGLCEKALHEEWTGYSHLECDDGPYSVDSITYCGRCHVVLE